MNFTLFPALKIKRSPTETFSMLSCGITKGIIVTTRAAMKTAISLPDSVFTEAELLAKQLGISRSELYTQALIAHLQQHKRYQTLEKLNQVYSQESSTLDSDLVKMQFESLPREDW